MRETELDETDAGTATCMVDPEALLTTQGVAQGFPSTENCMPCGTLLIVTCGNTEKVAVSAMLVVVVGMVSVWVAGPPLDQLTNDHVRPLESTCVAGALTVCVSPWPQTKL